MTANMAHMVPEEISWRRGSESYSSFDRPDDFESLKQAALAKLKSRKLRKRMLVMEAEGSTPEERAVEVMDMKNLKPAFSKKIVSRAFGEDAQDNIGVLEAMRDRLQKVDLAPPTITVRYRELTVSTHVELGSRGLPTLAGTMSKILMTPVRAASRKELSGPMTYSIIDSASGMIKPGDFTLLLGPPGSGKSQFLQSLAGRNRKTLGLSISAKELTYNGLSFDEFYPERSASYISQMDLHYGELTVRETFEFAARCQSTGARRAVLDEVKKREAALNIKPSTELDNYMSAAAFGGKRSIITEVLIQLLGLQEAAETLVGNQMMRGISGGQKKRVTTGEMAVGPARAVFADEISTGLDSATTYHIIRSLRNFTHVMNATMVIGLLQPGPETYDLFQDVILISNGRICFHGPREMVLPFFEGLGFYCPERQGVADFLQEITTPGDQAKYWAEGRPQRFQTAATIQKQFMQTDHWKAVEAELSQPFQKLAGVDHALAHTKYGAKMKELLLANARRAWTIQVRTKVFAIIRTVQVVLMAFVVATIFLFEDKNTVEDGNLFMGVLFYSILYQLLGALPEMHLLVERLPVMYKQRDSNFYPGWTFAVPAVLLRAPYSLLEATIWSAVVYWLVGFDSSSRFLIFWFLLFLTNLWSVGFFQLIAAICRDDTIATAVGSTFLLIFINVSGFVIIASDIPSYFKYPAFWPNPYAWVQRALSINEFTSSNWATPYNGGPTTLGEAVLDFRGFPTEYNRWIWGAVGYLIGTAVLNLFLLVLATTYLGFGKRRVVMSQEDLNEQTEARRASVSVPGGELGLADIENGKHRPVSPSVKKTVRVDAEKMVEQPKGDGSFVVSPRRGSTVSSDRLSFSLASAAEYRQRTVLPFDPLVMTFKDVWYSVPFPKDAEDLRPTDTKVEGPHAHQLQLLRGINGVFQPNILTALMGASGAGKTTLMDVLAGRKTEGLITGDIRVNGFPIHQKSFARVSGYVEQIDIHLPQATVEEAAHFSAALRLPTSVDAATRRHFVFEVLELVELNSIADAFVGTPGESGLSVEQRKRLTLAVEIVSNASCIFMDEPTSGLDARAAAIVMNAISNIVDTGRTVVCTIHQPNSSIFLQMSQLLLLKPGGKTIYFGPLGDESKNLIEYFEAVPGVVPIPDRVNPANWMLDVASDEQRLGLDFAKVYEQSSLNTDMLASIDEHHNPTEGAVPLEKQELKVPSWPYQFATNVRRYYVQYWRNPQYNITRFVITIIVGLAFGALFWGQGRDVSNAGSVLNVIGVLFSSALFVGITNCLTIQHLVSTQRAVFFRERAAGMYTESAFGLSQQLVELPYLVTQTFLFTLILYWMVGFISTAAKFFYFCLYFFLTLWAFTNFGIMAVTLTPALPLASVFCSFFFGFWNLLAGFLIPQPQIPKYWIWFYYINPVQWSIYGLAVTQLGDLEDETITDLQGNQVTVTTFLKERFDYEYSMRWPIVAILFGYVVVFAVASVLALKRLNYQRR